VRADNVVVDLNGHRVFGTPGPGNGRAVGIRIENRTGVTVQRGTVSDFDAGVLIRGGSANTLRQLVIRDNIGPADPDSEFGDGVAVINSPRNQIVNNVVDHNGQFDGIAILGDGSDANNVQANVVSDTVGLFNTPPLRGTGIVVANFFGDDPVPGAEDLFDNSVVQNVVQRNTGSGIVSRSNVRGRILQNTVEDNGPLYYGNEPLSGQGAGDGIALSKDPNSATDATRVLVEGNRVVNNGEVGVLVYLDADANVVRSNDVLDNGVAGIGIFTQDNRVIENRTGGNGIIDLLDANPDCDNNVWRRNTWGPLPPRAAEFGFTASYFPACTTTGGSGPNPSTASAPATAGAPAVARQVPLAGRADSPPLSGSRRAG